MSWWIQAALTLRVESNREKETTGVWQKIKSIVPQKTFLTLKVPVSH